MSWGQFLPQHWPELLALVALLAGSGFFSGTETALFNLTAGQLYRLGRGRSGMGRLVASLMQQPGRLLQTLLLGNMIVNVAYSALAAVMAISLARHSLGVWAVAAALAPVLVLILVGEVTPKMLAYRLAQRWAMLAAGPTAVLVRLLSPVVWLAENAAISPLARIIAPRRSAKAKITTEELTALLELSGKRGLITGDANALLREIVQLTDIRVAHVMVPRVDMIAYDLSDPPAGLVELFTRTRLRKIPVHDGDIDNIMGVIFSKQLLLAPETPLAELVQPVPFIPSAANIERALLQLRVKRKQMAVVVDEYGGTAGLVTLEDIVEEIVGDIEESQEAPLARPVQQIADSEYLLAGDLAIHEWVDAFSIDLSGRRISTIGGFVVSLLGRIPTAGDVATYRNLRFTVLDMRGRRIGRLRLELLGNDS